MSKCCSEYSPHNVLIVIYGLMKRKVMEREGNEMREGSIREEKGREAKEGAKSNVPI